MTVYLIGNTLVKEDNRPSELRGELEKAFPQIRFTEADPNENFIPEPTGFIIDTVIGIDRCRWFTDPESFEQTAGVSPHDYDLGFHLKLLLKLKKITGVRILGIPPMVHARDVISEISRYLSDTEQANR
jgi:hypothetical protein